MSFSQLARRIRHAPGLRHAEPLWAALRPLYHRLRDPFHRGVPVSLGGRAVRMPAELFSINPDWSSYERETLAALATWLDGHPTSPTLLDIGCSVGVVTSFALQLSPSLQAIAFDSDLVSLRAMDAVVPGAVASRVRRVHGLLGSTHASGASLAEAATTTLRRLPLISPRAAISRSQFVCFGEQGAAAVPQHQLDALLSSVSLRAPVLLKCDVEGAELLVLGGATRLLTEIRPDLLLSVHPTALPKFNQTTDDVAAFLRQHRYTWRILARDHEEHWFAEPLR